MFVIIIQQILKMLLLLLLGILCYRLKLIDQAGNKTLANLLLMVVNPFLAVMSLQRDLEPHLIKGLALSYGLAIATHLIAIAVSSVLFRSKNEDVVRISRISAIYSNCGFMGIPLVQSILGGDGVLYLTAYMTIFNILTWTHGAALLTDGKITAKSLKKGLLSPMVIASIIGLTMFFLQIKIPSVLSASIDYVAGMNTPMAMIIAGVSVAQVDVWHMLKQRSLYLVSFFKLLLMPALAFVMLYLLKIDSTVACTMLIAAACPTAATCTALSLRFHKDYKYASELYSFTTVMSLITIPLFVLIAEKLWM